MFMNMIGSLLEMGEHISNLYKYRRKVGRRRKRKDQETLSSKNIIVNITVITIITITMTTITKITKTYLIGRFTRIQMTDHQVVLEP